MHSETAVDSEILKSLLTEIYKELESGQEKLSVELLHNRYLVIQTEVHLIKVEEFRDGVIVDFFTLANGRSQISVNQAIEKGSLQVARLIRYLTLKIIKDYKLNLYVKPSDDRRVELYQKLAKKEGLEEKVKIIKRSSI